MLRKWILIFSLVLSLGFAWAQVNIIPVRTDVAGFPTWTDTDVAGTTYLQLLVANANTISPAMDFTAFSAETLDFKARTYGGTNAVENEVTVSISINNGASWTVLGTRTPTTNSLVNMAQFDLSAYNGTQVKIKFSVAGTSNTVGIGIDDISIKGMPSTPMPLLTVTPVTLTGLSYVEGSGPSAEQSFSLSGSALDGNVSLIAPTNYQISLASGSGFGSSLTVNHVAGTVAPTTVYTRLIAGLSVGVYNGETINITAGTAIPISVTLSGTVTSSTPTTGYLVDFDGAGEVKTSYATGTVNLSGLDWDMTEALIATSTTDFLNGIRSARFSGKATSSMTMLADKTGGLGTLSFPYRSYGTDAQVAWKAEYSSDAGATWNQIGSAFTATTTVQTFSEVVNVAGNVRIKISLVADTGGSRDKRLNIDDILLTDYTGASTPTIYATGTFTDFTTFTGTPSASQSYSLSGASLTGNITITAPAGFQVSTDDIAFAQTKSVASTFSGSIYVRLSGASAGTFSGNIAHTSTGATAVNLPVSGTVIAPTPTISLSGTLNAFTTTPGSPSAVQHYSVEGVYLTANIAITAPAGFELSLTPAGTYTSTLQLNHVSGTVAPTDVYVRLTGAALGTFSGNISHSSGAVTQNMAVTGTVAVSTAPSAAVLLRPTQISLADATHESAVLVKVENYSSDDARYRLYNGSNQYNPWNAITSEWSNTSSYGAGPNVPGTPSSSVSWWIPFQRGNNNTIVASYRDRLGTGYTTNYQTAALPTATAIVTGVPILKSQVNFITWNDFSVKHVVLAYDAANTLISAASTGLTDGAFTVWVETGTAITRIEVRDVMNNLLESVTGNWPQVLNPQILVTGTIDPLFNTAGLPSEEFGEYSLIGQDLTEDIEVTAPLHFEISTDSAGPFTSTLTLAPSFNGSIYVRINSEVIGEHGGDIVHSSVGAASVNFRVDGETLAPSGVITVTSNMTAFYQELGTPSASQSYSFSSTGLNSDIVITAGAPYELSQNGSTGWAASINVASSYNGLIYVRLNGIAVGTHNNVDIDHVHANASPVSITVSGTIGVPVGPVENLFFSEYIEGLSNNKAIEIFNASGSPVDLSRYKVELYSNGASTPNNTLALTGILAAGDVYVIANESAAAEILAVADITSTITYFNGDDALALRCINPPTLLDVFGQIGVDPGTGWPVAGIPNATVDHTLIRKSTVAQGNTDWAVQFGTDDDDSEWIVMRVGHHSDLGSHVFTPGGALDSPVVTIVHTGNNVDLTWTAITGASSYRIESSDDPYGTFTLVGTTNNTSYGIPATPAKQFFKVIAIQ